MGKFRLYFRCARPRYLTCMGLGGETVFFVVAFTCAIVFIPVSGHVPHQTEAPASRGAEAQQLVRQLICMYIPVCIHVPEGEAESRTDISSHLAMLCAHRRGCVEQAGKSLYYRRATWTTMLHLFGPFGPFGPSTRSHHKAAAAPDAMRFI